MQPAQKEAQQRAQKPVEPQHLNRVQSHFEAIGQLTVHAQRTAQGSAAAGVQPAGALAGLLASVRRGHALTEPSWGRHRGPPADPAPRGRQQAKRPAVARRLASADPYPRCRASTPAPAPALARYSYRTSRISYSRVPPGAETFAISPALRLMSAREIGLDTEIFPARISASSSPTI